jgi:hypothetical protein
VKTVRSQPPLGRRKGLIASLVGGVALVVAGGFAIINASPTESGAKAFFRECVEEQGGEVLDSMTIRIDRVGRRIIGGGIGDIDPDLVAACLDAIPHETDR